MKVERNQTRWLADNDTLFQDLEEALLENQNLRERNCVIEEALQVRNLKDLSSITIIEH